MKKLLLFLIVLGLAGGGVFYYLYFQQKDRKVDVWSLPPEGALWIYESTQIVKSWNKLLAYPYWRSLSALPFLSSLEGHFEKLDSLAGKEGNMEKMLRNNPFLISCHLTARNEFGYVFYFRIKEPAYLMQVRSILSHYVRNGTHAQDSRNFAGYTIHEITGKRSDEVFSYLIVNDHFVGSFDPFLVEDVIRNLDSRNKFGFFRKHAAFASMNKVRDDDGNLYVDASLVAQFLGVFAFRDHPALQNLSRFASSIYFDMEAEKDFLLLNGSVHVPEDSGQYFLSGFKGQKASKLNLEPLVPARAAGLYKYSFSDPVKWQMDMNAFWHKSSPEYYKARAAFEEEHELSAPLFNNWIGGIGYAFIESVHPDDPDQLIYLSAKDLNEGLNRFNRLSELSAERKGDTVYVENYGTHVIGMVDIPRVPEMLFGPMFSGFEQCYFTSYGNYIILSNRNAVIKSLLTDIETDNVWGKSINHSRFLENTLPESNISLIVNTERIWNSLQQRLNNEWKPVFREHALLLKKFEFLAIQFNQTDGRFYSGIIVQINHETSPEIARQQFVVNQQVETDAPVITRPFIVRNHNDKSLEVVLQDSLNQIYLISKDGEILWKLRMQNPVVGDIHQIDFFRNGKLQYLYADESSIKLIDRNGNFVDGFPMHFPDSIKIQTLSVIDYDNSRNYRMLVSDREGRLYMFNMNRELLEGWSPLILSDKVAYPPQHMRVRGRDCLLAVGKKGTVHLFNRRGENYAGFPLNLNDETVGPMYFENGSSFGDAKFTVVNQNGVILQFNLLGKTLRSIQLYKPSKETKFVICPDAMMQTFIIARQDYNRLNILDQKGETIFQKDYVTSGDLAVQYYHYSMDNRIYAVTDKVQEFTYIYDHSGELINYQPLESGFEIGLVYSDAQKRFQVYSCYDNKFTVSSFYR